MREAVLVFGGVIAVARLPQLATVCHARGLVVLAIDEPSPMANAVAARLRDEPGWRPAVADVHLGDGTNPSAFIDAIDRWRRRFRLAGAICTVDSLTPLYGMVSDWLGLPHPGLRATAVCRSKLLQRKYLADFSPLSRYLGDRSGALEEAADWDTYPAVLKPSGRSSSSGVRSVNDRGELLECLGGDGYRDGEDLLLEEKVIGPEFSVESLSQGGEVKFISVTGKRTNSGNSQFFVELGHTFPAQIEPKVRQALIDAHQGVLSRLDFRDGISHGEFKCTNDGQVRLMEIAARTPGDGFVAAYHLATGTPLEAALVDIACGLPVSYGPLRRIVRQIYLEHEPGVLDRIDYWPADETWPQVRWMPEDITYPDARPSAPDEPARVHMVLGLNRPGDTLREIRESHHRAATVILDGRTVEELDGLEAEVRSRVRVVTK